MKKTILTLCLALSLAAPALSVQAASQAEIDQAIKVLQQSSSQGLVDRYSLADLERIIKAEGYSSVTTKGDNKVVFKSDGHIFSLFLYKDGDLQIYFGAQGVKVTTDDINKWNKEHRLSRAYLDDDGDLALEADMFANGGLNEKMVKALVSIFVNTSVPAFIEFAKEHDKS
ncbi:YbjN domain-containing protein [Pseudaeromonas paramecii]|uniref:YbjN domain-containing protein n=1 Tax=Pseudaeromonas paramecii TaxID=2138166 RepID=A0ABP8Q599_9GAMM